MGIDTYRVLAVAGNAGLGRVELPSAFLLVLGRCSHWHAAAVDSDAVGKPGDHLLLRRRFDGRTSVVADEQQDSRSVREAMRRHSPALAQSEAHWRCLARTAVAIAERNCQQEDSDNHLAHAVADGKERDLVHS